MKYKYTKKVLLSLTLCALAFGINTNSVKAATATIEEIGDKYYYYSKTSNSKYGEYYGTSYKSGTAEKYTYYKKLLISGKTKAEAYCVQSTDKSPKIDDNYTEISWGSKFGDVIWKEELALKAGRVIEKIRADKGDYTKEAYVYIYSTLNSLLKLNGSENYSKYNSGMKKYIEEAEAYLNDTVKTTTTIPNYTITANNSGYMTSHVPSNANSTTYYTGSVSLTNLYETYGGDKVSYQVTVSSTSGNVAICTNSNCSSTSGTSATITGKKSDTIYLKATNVSSNDTITINVNASNSSTYRIARLWKHKKNENEYQALATYSSKPYKRANNKKAYLYIPDPTKKTFAVEKVDNSSLESIEGSNLKMTIYSDAAMTTELTNCSITSGKTSCNGSVNNDIATTLYYKISEGSAPAGYILGTEKTGTWNLTSSSTTCQKSKIGEDSWTSAELTECNTSYISGNLCYDKENNTYTEGECAIETPETDTVKPVDETDTGTTDDTTTETTTPNDNPTEDTTETKYETQLKCYVKTNDTVNIVDDSKCEYDYLKITTSGGNLKVQFPNTKNTIKISKQSITGTTEIGGAELKICSTKPDENGDCTIVRNTLSGTCKSDETDTENGGAGLTNEYNCTYDATTGNKTIDMHWFSGDAPKIWNGIPTGTYYLVETLAPRGYIISTTITEFSIDKNGIITSDSYDEENSQIVLKNEITKLTISKTDIATSKELPGATLSICNAYQDDNGNWNKFVNDEGYCTPVILADGTSATWESTEEPHYIEGLGVGTYYLVETSAPNGYATAESILFTMNADGTLSDKDGNPLADNKLEMKDAAIEETKTGDLPILVIVLIAVGAISLGSYYYINNSSNKSNSKVIKKIEETTNKIRKRKIHK